MTFEPKSMMVTGGAGFIGSHVTERLLEHFPNSRVIVFDNLCYCASMLNLKDARARPNFKFVHGDITSADLVSYVLETEGIDCILHFAAETHVDNSFGNSFSFTKTNVLGTHVLLEAAKKWGKIKKFIHVSTDEVYGESKGTESFEEEAVLEPTNPYAATKAGAEALVKAYHRSFQLPAVITRGNNVYGPRQYPEKVVPKFIHQMFRNMPLTVHGEGATVRNMLYITDVVDAFITILEHSKPGSTINIGGLPENEHSILDIANNILKLFNREDESEEYVKFVEDRKFNDTRYNIDNSKLIELGWKPKVGFEEGLQRTLDWYQHNGHEKHWGSVEHALVSHPRAFGDDQTHPLTPL